MSYPHLVVAVVCQKDDKVLMVKEIDNGITCWNQPAGHVELGEDLITAAKREALEETGYSIEIIGLMGIYEGVHKVSGTHFVRICFYAKALEKITTTLDSDIIEAQWVDRTDLLSDQYVLRSELTRQTLEDLDSSPNYPLSLIKSTFPGDVNDR